MKMASEICSSVQANANISLLSLHASSVEADEKKSGKGGKEKRRKRKWQKA